MKQDIVLDEVIRISAQHQIEIKKLESATGSFGKKIFFINQELLLRVSETPMTREQEKFYRVSRLNFVPQIHHVGVYDSDPRPLYYTILTLLQGDDFVNVYPETTFDQQHQLGQAVADFLDNLHGICGPRYDIGLYIPVIPDFSGTWRAGHERYWEILEEGSTALNLQSASIQVFAKAFQFLRESASALDFQAGPKLLHNDFHPKNLLLHQGKFSGVIDWECSQYGEADFDLSHWIHWCIFPPQSNIDFRPFLQALFRSAPRCTQVPYLAQRLTIYQIEHEIQQIIWQGSEAESWRVPRLEYWIAGGVDELMKEIK